MLMRTVAVEGDMSREAPAEDAVAFLTPEEPTEALADATGTNPEEIERGAAALDIAHSEEADSLESDTNNKKDENTE